jgi:hypothetical protein
LGTDVSHWITKTINRLRLLLEGLFDKPLCL